MSLTTKEENIQRKGKGLTPTFNPPPSRGRREKFPSPQRGGRSGWGGLVKTRARTLRKNPTDVENKLWSYLRHRQIEGHKFRRQQPIGKYIVDFACMEEKLIIELDGGQHNERIDYDAERTVWLKSEGYQVIRFWNDEALKNIEIVMDEIYRALHKQLRWGDRNIMGRIEHITTQQIIGEWGSIDKFALSHGVSPASTKMVIYVDGAKSRPVEEAMRKYGYLNLLRIEKELRKRGRTFSDYLQEDGLNPVEVIETIRMKEAHPEVVSGLKREGLWDVLEGKEAA